jgi:hypothetical protein
MSSTIALKPTHPKSAAPTARVGIRTHPQWVWLLAGLMLAFAVPYVFADLLSLNRDVYYGIYTLAVVGFLALWLRLGTQSPRRMLTRNWRLGFVLGAVFAGLEVAIALTDKATTHPQGWTFADAILWRGVVYGATDGLLLSVCPILAVFAAFASRPLRERTKRAVTGIGALALAVSIVFTAVYHLGYPDFRGSKLKKPVVGDLVWSVPTLMTLSPVGAPIAHIGLHVTAVVHSYDTNTFLPPHAEHATRATVPAFTDASPTAIVKIYLGVGNGSDCARVVAVRRFVARPAALHDAMSALLKGPTASEKRAGFGGWFTARTAGMLRSVRLSHGTAYVDFRDLRHVIPNASSSCGSTLLLAQLDRTAKQFTGVRHTLYSLNGNRRAFYEWLQLSTP